jgi:hypothetical protein
MKLLLNDQFDANCSVEFETLTKISISKLENKKP